MGNMEPVEGEDGVVQQFEMYDNLSEFIKNFEDSKKRKKKVKKVKLGKFMAD